MRRHSTQGFALIIVIWILTLLSLIAGSFALSMRRESSVTYALRNSAGAVSVAESGFALAQFVMSQPDPEQQWRADGTLYQLRRQDGSIVRIKIEAEAGKIDINTAKKPLLEALLSLVTADNMQQQQLLNNIVDWRDEDDDTQSLSSEAKQYQLAGLPYVPANKPFKSVEELQMVLGMNPQMFIVLQPYLTTYSGQQDVDQTVASPQVLALVGNNMGNGQNTATGNRRPPINGAPGGSNGSSSNGIYTVTSEVLMADGSSAALQIVTKIQPPPVAISRSNQNQEQSQTIIPMQAEVYDWKQNQLTQSLFADTSINRVITVRDEFTNNN